MHGICTFSMMLWLMLGVSMLHSTKALANGSLAVDAAPDSALNIDFDGDIRPHGSSNDIGADESSLTDAAPVDATLSNGYFAVGVTDGMITSLRLDATGLGNYGPNTIASTGHLGFLLDGVALSSPSATIGSSSSQLTISGLPQGATLRITLSGNSMSEILDYSGSKLARHEWDLVYLDEGFYQRATGRNYSPDAVVEMPFESFYDKVSGIYRPVEHFKRGANTQVDLYWSRTHCRGRVANDVVFSCSHASMNVLPQAEKLTLLHSGTVSNRVTATFQVLPKTYASTLDGNKPLPEFYVRPEQTIRPYSDAAITHAASDLLTELFQHSVFWFGAGGPIWCDWSMMAGSFMDNPYRESVMPTGTIIGDDGFGRYGYAYVWGDQRGWPFPGGKDTRHFDTNAIYISAVWRYVMWSGNRNYLQSGTCDRAVQIDYGNGNLVRRPPNGSTSYPANISGGTTLGQSFTATGSFTRVAAHNPTWGSTTSGFRLTLYDQPGGNAIASQVFTNCVDGAYNYVNCGTQPAGEYYLEMSEAQGMIGWWSSTTDAYSGGAAYLNGYPLTTIIERCRALMNYQQQTLLGATEKLLVLGPNIGSSDHGARHAIDVGSNYYDILPFGYKEAFTNADYYRSLRAMADLEELLGNRETAADYRQNMQQTREKYNETFWRTGLDRDQSARYIGTVDMNGVDRDYGFTFINTKAIEAGLAEGYPGRVAEVYQWMDNGESRHSDATRDNVIRIGYSDGSTSMNADPNKGGAVPNALATGQKLTQYFFAKAPFTSAASLNPTWNTTQSGFTLSLYQRRPWRLIATQTFNGVADNSLNTLTFAEQPAGYYALEMSNGTGTIGWWSSPWVNDLNDRWVFSPRTTTISNTDWWAYPVGTGSGRDYDPTAPDFAWRWDVQLQNGGTSLYEAGFDLICRARYLSADSAWDRLQILLRRYSDPDRLCSRRVGFYGESIQGDGSAGSVGWMRSEFPETAVLGAAYFLGFFGVDPAADGLHLTPRIPTGRGITTLGARNINYHGALFTLEATASTMRVTCTSNPINKTFYMTGGHSGAGQFDVNVPLLSGSMVLSTLAPPTQSMARMWEVLE